MAAKFAILTDFFSTNYCFVVWNCIVNWKSNYGHFLKYLYVLKLKFFVFCKRSNVSRSEIYFYFSEISINLVRKIIFLKEFYLLNLMQKYDIELCVAMYLVICVQKDRHSEDSQFRTLFRSSKACILTFLPKTFLQIWNPFLALTFAFYEDRKRMKNIDIVTYCKIYRRAMPTLRKI